MTLLLYALASFGVAFFLGYSKISYPIRTWLGDYASLERDPQVRRIAAGWLLALLECPACVAFWLGVAASFTSVTDALPLTAPFYVLAPLFGFANMGASLALGMAVGLIRAE